MYNFLLLSTLERLFASFICFTGQHRCAYGFGTSEDLAIMYRHGIWCYAEEHSDWPDLKADKFFVQMELENKELFSELFEAIEGGYKVINCEKLSAIHLKHKDEAAKVKHKLESSNEACTALLREYYKKTSLSSNNDLLKIAASDLGIFWPAKKFGLKNLVISCNDGILMIKNKQFCEILWLQMHKFRPRHMNDGKIELSFSDYNALTILALDRMMKNSKLSQISIDVKIFDNLLALIDSLDMEQPLRKHLYDCVVMNGLFGIGSKEIFNGLRELRLCQNMANPHWWLSVLEVAAKVSKIEVSFRNGELKFIENTPNTNFPAFELSSVEVVKYIITSPSRLLQKTKKIHFSKVLGLVLREMSSIKQVSFTNSSCAGYSDEDDGSVVEHCRPMAILKGFEKRMLLLFIEEIPFIRRCREVDIFDCRLGHDLGFLKSFDLIQALRLRLCNLDHISLQSLAGMGEICGSLKRLDLSYNIFGLLESLGVVFRFPSLVHLSMVSCELHSTQLNNLSSVSELHNSLEHMNLSGNDFSGTFSLCFIANFVAIKFFMMNLCNLRSPSISTIPADEKISASLKVLHLRCNPELEDIDLAFIWSFPSLEELDLYECNLNHRCTSGVDQAVEPHKSLTILVLEKSNFAEMQSLNFIFKLPALSALNMNSCMLGSAALNSIWNQNNIHEGLVCLYLVCNNFDSRLRFNFVDRLVALQILNMNSSKVSSDSKLSLENIRKRRPGIQIMCI